MKKFIAGMSAVLVLMGVVAKVEAYPIGTTFTVEANVDNLGVEANAAFGSPDTGITATVELLPGMVWRYGYLVKAVEPGILQQFAFLRFTPQAGALLTEIVIQTGPGFLAGDYVPVGGGPVGTPGTWTGVERIDGIRFGVSCSECNISFLSYNEPTWGGFMASGMNGEDAGFTATAMISAGMDASSISGPAPLGYILVPGDHVDPPVVDPVPVPEPGVLALLIFGVMLFPRRKG